MSHSPPIFLCLSDDYYALFGSNLPSDFDTFVLQVTTTTPKDSGQEAIANLRAKHLELESYHLSEA